MRIGKRVMELLKQQNKKQVDLAKYLNISTSTVHGWRNENRNPSSDLIIPLSNYFGVSVEYLLTGVEPANPNGLTEEQTELINQFEALDKQERQIIIGKIAEMHYNKKNEERSQAKEEIADEIIPSTCRLCVPAGGGVH